MLKPHISVQKLNVWYGRHHAVKDVSVDIPRKQITVIIGPSGCGKTTLFRSLNRLVELTEGVKISGKVLVDDVNIYNPKIDVTEVRKKMGMIAQTPNPLPMSIYDNVAYGPKIHGAKDGKKLDGIVRRHLQAAGLWNEVKNRLLDPASKLSSGQQQRLCLARALAVEPEIVLGDEPTSALDPVSSQRIEKVLTNLKKNYTVVVVTHILRQAMRIADYVIFFYMGELIEHGPSREVFKHPRRAKTRAYLKGVIS